MAMPARMLASALAAPQTPLASITAFENETATLSAAKTIVTAMAFIQHFIIEGLDWLLEYHEIHRLALFGC